ncbi:MAG TPA: hypothetical protein VME63_00590 [Dyella sp.]|uniref:hypothetical protein n=1 Tax=Dyella sp. TaxID=1869338 RepID=UPI002C16B546|nr:hypothetical protein [Dyella sp.]HTV83873.1 hypothetical protein [Dyella sp.]
MDFSRTLVIGNTGAGKSWLAERLAEHQRATWVDLDTIHWLPGRYDAARERENAIALAQAQAQADTWVIEGIYGWLIEAIQARATALVWLRLDEAECLANLSQRGMRRGGTQPLQAKLIGWMRTYKTRTGSSSYAAHARIFNDFPGAKTCLDSRADVTGFIETLA